MDLHYKNCVIGRIPIIFLRCSFNKWIKFSDRMELLPSIHFFSRPQLNGFYFPRQTNAFLNKFFVYEGLSLFCVYVYVIAWGRVELRINFHAYFQSFHKIAPVAKRRRQFVKTLKIRINKFFEVDFAIKVNASNERRFDRSTVIFKFGVRIKLHV